MLDTNNATDFTNIITDDNDFRSFIAKQLVTDNSTYITSYLQKHSNKEYISVNICNHYLHLGNAGNGKTLRKEFSKEDLGTNSLITQAEILINKYINSLSIENILNDLLSELSDFMFKYREVIIGYATYKYMTLSAYDGFCYQSVLRGNIDVYITSILSNFKQIYAPIINNDPKESISKLFDAITMRLVNNDYPILVKTLILTIDNEFLMQPKFADADISSMLQIYFDDRFNKNIQIELPIRQIKRLFTDSIKPSNKTNCLTNVRLSFNSTSDIIWLMKLIIDNQQKEYDTEKNYDKEILKLQKLGIHLDNTDQYTSYVQDWLDFYNQGDQIPPIVARLRKVLLSIFSNCH